MALMPVDTALAEILADLDPLPAETVAIGEADGRVLAAALSARRSQPEADMSAMDGYAVASDALPGLPARLRVIGTSAAGHPFQGRVGAGEAVRIFTGALVPAGADTVVIQENTSRDGDDVTLIAATGAGRNVRLAGFDFAAGGLLLPAGHRLDARSLMLAAAGNLAELPVRRRPRIAILQTGDELVRPGDATGAASEVVVSNVYGLAALCRAAGAHVDDLGLVRDDMDATRSAVRDAASRGYDILVTSGGASVGEHDLIAPALRAEGIALSVHKIALRPGKPLMFGRRADLRVLGLPGNPVSAYVCALLFLVPLVNALQGAAPGPNRRPARLAAPVRANDGRRDYMRARTTPSADGGLAVAPFATQDSAMLSVLAQADCLLIREPNAPPGEPGDGCEIIPFNA
ncbi:gephyrin-like molybdotransferase Glp [Aquabacter spiritensis]|uniref:Molybdopterin molybdenumtransferase n=1 Tax=Aquabacter spiritensis TaxID=933073 RepID=A0A4R3LKB2_9HYPH|nr:gephyrin-like molybdotransferase Glp [Aquabacter spiritensis]TCT00624.1 molybdopterin molybdochelatase [Aquabacter spiritensis]